MTQVQFVIVVVADYVLFGAGSFMFVFRVGGYATLASVMDGCSSQELVYSCWMRWRCGGSKKGIFY